MRLLLSHRLLISLPCLVPMTSGALAQETPLHPTSAIQTQYAIESLHWSDSADGSLWVRGSTYKARFGADGVDYVPFFGSAAPRNYPVSFRLEGATVGGLPLELADRAFSVRRVGDSVEIDRGGLLVRYHVGLDSIEQTFVLTRRAGAGELAVRVAVDTDLAFARGRDGFEFAGDLGAVRYSEALVLDDAGRRVAVTSKYDESRIEITVPASFMASADYPVTVDPVISTFSVNTNHLIDQFSPDAAYDATFDQYLIVWEQIFSATDHDVYGQLVDAAGVNLQAAYVEQTSADWRKPAVANNNAADQFLVVAEAGAPGSRLIWGRMWEAGTTVRGQLFIISNTSFGEKINPDVGGDPSPTGSSRYAVVWERVYTSSDHDIHYQLVRPDTSLVYGSNQILDGAFGTLDIQPAVSKSNGAPPASTQRWNVAYSRTTSAANRDTRAAQLDRNGAIVSSPFTIDSSGTDDIFPEPSSPLDAAAGERDWLVVYMSSDMVDWDVRGTLLSGGTVLRNYNITDELEATSFASRWQDKPAVTSDGTQFTLFYGELHDGSSIDFNVFATTLRHDLDRLTAVEVHQLAAGSQWAESSPAITSTHDGGGADGRFLATWHQRTFPNNHDIEAALYDAPATYANVGSVSCLSSTNSTGEPADFRALGSSAVASNSLFFDVDDLPPNEFGYFLMGQSSGSMPVASGVLCIANPVYRLNQSNQHSGSSGSVSNQQDLTAVPSGATLLAGQTWHFQYWYRNGSSSNFSNSVAIAFD